MRYVFTLILIAVTSSGFAQVPDSYIDTLIAERDKSKVIEQKELEKELAKYQKQLTTLQSMKIDSPAKKLQIGQSIKKTNEQIADTRKAIKAADAKDHLAIPPLKRALIVGSIGRMRHESIKVTQVVSKNTAICSWPGENYVAVVGDDFVPRQGKATPFIYITDTTGWHDDQDIELDGVYASVDPKSYTSVLGAKKTLPVVEEMDEKKIKEKWQDFNQKK